MVFLAELIRGFLQVVSTLLTVQSSLSRNELRERLANAALELVDIPSESGQEAGIADHVEARLAASCPSGLAVTRDGNAVLALPAGFVPGAGIPLVLFVGHLDTVPAQENLPGRICDGQVHGLGAADMKGALSVMLELAAWASNAHGDRALDAGFLFYDKEELPVVQSGLTPLFHSHPEITSAGLAIVMEPTGGEIQAGCLGNIQADVLFRGRSGHSARPWLAENAIHKGILALADLSRLEPVDDVVDGLTYREVCSVTKIGGGLASNVIPDEMSAHVNFRYSPRRSPEEAEVRLRELVSGDEVTVVSNASGAMPGGDNPLLERLRGVSGASVTPKQAWTDVAQFATRGLDAVNFGPGDPRLAHTREESVSIDALVDTFDVLSRFLVTS